MGSKKRPPGSIIIRGIGGRTGKKMTDQDRKTLNIPKGKKKLIVKPKRSYK